MLQQVDWKQINRRQFVGQTPNGSNDINCTDGLETTGTWIIIIIIAPLSGEDECGDL